MLGLELNKKNIGSSNKDLFCTLLEYIFFLLRQLKGDENNHFQTKGVHAGSMGVTI